MPANIIEVENLSKLYKLGKIGTGTLSHDINRWWYRMRGKDDPYELEAGTNDRTKKDGGNYVWSLKELHFSVEEGDVFGVIGNNGAGKSTLLKILSKITKPTKGVIHINGRISSLLEVGTGFHPELTGRENIFLNGAILGMRKAEIRKHFDEIVEFSGVQRYIDTPVKRYSSGMFVRLAFAVGAYLEPDILIIDEVLAVGDADFQQKCLGKMREFSQSNGRTVIFVSHNVAAIKQLCNRGLLLENGRQKACGSMKEVLSLYQRKQADSDEGKRGNVSEDKQGYFTDWRLENSDGASPFSCDTGDLCVFTLGFYAREPIHNCEVRLALKYQEFLLMNVSSLAEDGMRFSISAGYHRFRFQLELPLRSGEFDVLAAFVSFSKELDFWVSTTKLAVKDNFSADLVAGLIQPKIEFTRTAGEDVNALHLTA